MLLLGMIVTMAHLWIVAADTVEVQRVQLGATVTMGCNLSYIYHTAWVKHNKNGPPTLVIFASLKKGNTIYGYQPDPRFLVEFVNQSLLLTINDVEEKDLGMYYCMANVDTQLLIGSGTVLQGPFQISFYHWYSAAVSSALLSVVICVCVIHWKTKVHRKVSINQAQKDHNGCNVCAIELQEV